MSLFALGRAPSMAPSTPDTDVLERNPAAWTAAALQQAHLPDVFRYVARSVPRREEAEDITAEVFAAAFQSLHRFRGDCTARAWLLGIARRKVADHLRKTSRRRETLEADLPETFALAEASADGSVEAAIQRKEAREELRRAVDALPSDQHDALLLHYVDGLTIAEVSVVLGRSAAAANSLLQRARASVYRHGAHYFID